MRWGPVRNPYSTGPFLFGTDFYLLHQQLHRLFPLRIRHIFPQFQKLPQLLCGAFRIRTPLAVCRTLHFEYQPLRLQAHTLLLQLLQTLQKRAQRRPFLDGSGDLSNALLHLQQALPDRNELAPD